MRLNRVGNKAWRILAWCLVLAWIIFGIPEMDKIFRPDLVTKIEKMLVRTTFTNCAVKVNRDNEVSILISVRAGEAAPITTKLSKYELNELNRTDSQIEYIAHTINQHPDGSYYLTQTRIWAGADLKQARRIEVKYCDRLAGDARGVTYDGHVPVFACVVPVAEASCAATDRDGN